MKAGVLHAKEDIRFEEVEKPSLKEGTVRVNVKACGICGSDIPRVNEGTAHFFPIILGHEFSGVIDEVGEGVTGLEKGDHVCCIPLIPCMECDDCKAGNFALCKHYKFVGTRTNGGYAEYCVLPAANVLKIDKSIPFAFAAMFEPCSVALHALLMSGFKPCENAAVLGGGTIGLFTLQWMKLFGAKNVTVIGRSKERLELSKKFGAEHTVSVLDEDAKEQLDEITSGKGFDFIYEVAGSTDAMKMSFELVANKGTVCLIGTPKKEITFDVKLFEQLNRKEFNLTGSWMSYSAPFPGEEWTRMAEEFAKGTIKVIPEMIYKEYPLSEIADAFEEFKTPGKVKGKILIVND